LRTLRKDHLDRARHACRLPDGERSAGTALRLRWSVGGTSCRCWP